jgi:hypothetical protein
MNAKPASEARETIDAEPKPLEISIIQIVDGRLVSRRISKSQRVPDSI